MGKALAVPTEGFYQPAVNFPTAPSGFPAWSCLPDTSLQGGLTKKREERSRHGNPEVCPDFHQSSTGFAQGKREVPPAQLPPAPYKRSSSSVLGMRAPGFLPPEERIPRILSATSGLGLPGTQAILVPSPSLLSTKVPCWEHIPVLNPPWV